MDKLLMMSRHAVNYDEDIEDLRYSVIYDYQDYSLRIYNDTDGCTWGDVKIKIKEYKDICKYIDVYCRLGKYCSELFSDFVNLISVNFLEPMALNDILYAGGMFRNCVSLEHVGSQYWHLPKVTDTSYMFGGCISLKRIDSAANWDIATVVNAEAMFYNCKLLQSLNFSKWHTSNIENMLNMFYGCELLESLPIWYKQC